MAQIVIISMISIFASLIIGVFIGINYERKNWNKLIDKGIIPKPKTK